MINIITSLIEKNLFLFLDFNNDFDFDRISLFCLHIKHRKT